jgi:hypothetical protein
MKTILKDHAWLRSNAIASDDRTVGKVVYNLARGDPFHGSHSCVQRRDKFGKRQDEELCSLSSILPTSTRSVPGNRQTPVPLGVLTNTLQPFWNELRLLYKCYHVSHDLFPFRTCQHLFSDYQFFLHATEQSNEQLYQVSRLVGWNGYFASYFVISNLRSVIRAPSAADVSHTHIYPSAYRDNGTISTTSNYIQWMGSSLRKMSWRRAGVFGRMRTC